LSLNATVLLAYILGMFALALVNPLRMSRRGGKAPLVGEHFNHDADAHHARQHASSFKQRHELLRAEMKHRDHRVSIAAVEKAVAVDSEASVVTAFLKCDINRDGQLSREELTTALSKRWITQQQCVARCAAVDALGTNWGTRSFASASEMAALLALHPDARRAQPSFKSQFTIHTHKLPVRPPPPSRARSNPLRTQVPRTDGS
jgi:hypothetical protein